MTLTKRKTQFLPAIQYWLFASAMMVLCMAVIGAVTRLTESGLSMVEWRPLIGALPPLSAEEWQRVYDLYKQSPEFEHKHYWMSLAEFKNIFFWEWFHRLWGRLIGLVYGLPFFYFLIRGQIPDGYKLRLWGLLILGGLQGVIGWWMVKSGLIDRPDVDHFRLTVHLGMAIFIYAILWWTILDLRGGKVSLFHNGPHKALRLSSLFLLILTMVWGAFVAGLEAGRLYNSFPLMDGALTPSGAWSLSGMVYDHGWVQFVHRWLAKLAAAVILVYAFKQKSYALGAMVVVQVGLGIGALMTSLMIPVAAAHQAGAIILLTILLNVIHRNRQGNSRDKSG